MSEKHERRKVVLGITGSIAAYKAAELARILVSRGYKVRTVMSASAQKFITPTTMQAITGNPVITDFWDSTEVGEIDHIALADWADVIAIAPATANAIAKLANGLADSPLYAIALATKAPILVAPAMNTNMLAHPATIRNLDILRERGVEFAEPSEGELACGWHGSGRLAEPWQIFCDIERTVSTCDFKGKHVLITTGPTREPIDPVRFLSNRSSGKMGVALAREAYRRGAKVTIVHGPVSVKVPSAVELFPVLTAEEMRARVISRVYEEEDAPDIVIMASAVADYRPVERSEEKIKKSKDGFALELQKNPDILLELGSKKPDGQKRPLLVGFAVETGELDDLLDQVRSKLENKKSDLIIGNFAEDAFDLDTNRVWLIDRTGRQEEVATTYKSRVANRILDATLRIW